MIASYLSEREILVEAEDINRTRWNNSVVPQVSVLGPPTLWNFLYDPLLSMGHTDGEENFVNKANRILQKVANWMEDNELEKTVVVLMTRKKAAG